VYHGPDGLREIAARVDRMTAGLGAHLRTRGVELLTITCLRHF